MVGFYHKKSNSYLWIKYIYLDACMIIIRVPITNNIIRIVNDLWYEHISCIPITSNKFIIILVVKWIVCLINSMISISFNIYLLVTCLSSSCYVSNI